ncbi:hypothetical protein TNCV_654741 [Trichonephila clavipes]|nr:hypothetical protein TNCV_654741 [Trichonephila clavipes]
MPDRTAGPVRLQTRAVVISTETESGFITEGDTSPVCHTQVARGRQNPVDTAYDVGSVVSVLADVGSSSQLRSVVSLLWLFSDSTGCLEGGGAERRHSPTTLYVAVHNPLLSDVAWTFKCLEQTGNLSHLYYFWY